MVNQFLKRFIRMMGFTIERRDPLVESIPASYETSPYLPRVYMQSAARLLYFKEMVDRTARVEGDVVECGTSIGHGLLYFMLLSELAGVERTFYGFDSFEGFPAPTEADRGTHVYQGYYANSPEIVIRVLKDGRVPERTIADHLHLVKGFFKETVPKYEGRIALLHLDCDLYESYRECLAHLYGKVVAGGVVLFDDYENAKFPGARKAVDEFFSNRDRAIERHWCGKYYVVKKR
jgi:hypothetical protein